MPMRPLLLLVSLLLSPLPALPALDQVWLVGGGPDLFNSQVQIERNILWTLETLGQLPGGRRVQVYFTDGEDPAPDVVEWAPALGAEQLEPLARVFDAQWGNGEQYRNHRIPDVAGATTLDSLRTALGAGLGQLDATARAWLIFDGHGGRGSQGNNRLHLWDNGQLSVRELGQWLDQAPEGARIRFLFTQCYAGGFGSLAVADRDRCGFLAVSADQTAEGCSAAIEGEDYQDYSTHFFAALAGHRRDGSALPSNPDRDGDGRVTPLEAHHYTLLQANSSDIPRSTSELLLEQWQPWYLSALALVNPAPAENPYRTLADALMHLANLDPARDGEPALARRTSALRAQTRQLAQEQAALAQQTEQLRQTLVDELQRRWPALRNPYSRQFAQFLAQDLDAAQTFIQAREDYQRLKANQEAQGELASRALELERAATRLEKIRHLGALATKLAALEQIGPPELRTRYATLRACETTPF